MGLGFTHTDIPGVLINDGIFCILGILAQKNDAHHAVSSFNFASYSKKWPAQDGTEIAVFCGMTGITVSSPRYS